MPTCTTHQKPMRPGRGGGYFCATKMPDGSWCQYKLTADEAASLPQEPAQPSGGANTYQPGPTPKDMAITRQTAWKCACFLNQMKQWELGDVQELSRFIEKDMLSAWDSAD